MDRRRDVLLGEWKSIERSGFWEQFWADVKKARDAEAERVLNGKNTRDEDMYLKGIVAGMDRVRNLTKQITKKITGV